MKNAVTFMFVVLLLTVGLLPAPAKAGESEAQSEQQASDETGQGVATATLRSGRLKELSSRYLENDDEAGFWSEIQKISDAGGYPFVEEIEGPSEFPADYVRLTFLHREGNNRPENVLLFANINHVVPAELLFAKIGQSDIYFKTVEVPPSVRFMYRIIENDPLTGLFAAAKYGTRMRVLGRDPDPFSPNRQVIPNALGPGTDFTVAWVELPGASPQPYVVDKGNPRGELMTQERESTTLGYSHQIFTYLPPDYDSENSYPLMILFDGGSYFSNGSLQLTLENLIADGSIPPLVVLGINAGIKEGQNQRNVEFTCNPNFMEFLDEELLPWFTSKYNVSADPDHRVIAGSSFGGLFATYFAFNHPETVSHVLSQSGSFHWGRQEDEIQFEWLIRQFAFADKKPITIFMEVGVLEGEYSWADPEFPHAIVSHRHFKTVLDMKGYDVKYQEYAGGHEMLSWRGGIAEGLKHLLRPIDPN